MRKRWYIFLFLFILAMAAACAQTSSDSMALPEITLSDSLPISSPTPTPTAPPTPIPTPTPTTTPTPAFTENKYTDYMAALNPDILGMDELFYAERDIDGDGNIEIVAAFGDYSGDGLYDNYIETSFVLRDADGEINLLAKNLCDGGYMRSSFQLAQFTGSDEWYIVVNVTNTAGLDGLGIYEVSGDAVNEVAYDASATGAGNSYLNKPNSDGTYDGYTSERYSYDVFGCIVVTRYTFKDGAFVQQKSSVDVRDYPNNPTDAVKKWLMLKELSKTYDSDDITNRLNELAGDLDLEFNFSYEDWHSLMLFPLDPDQLPIYISEATGGDASTVTISVYGDEYSLDEKFSPTWQAVFQLSQTNGKWHINSISKTI